LVPEYAYAAPRRRPGFFARFFFGLLLMAFLGSLALNFLLGGVAVVGSLGSSDTDGRIQEKYVSHNRNGQDKVAILSIEGTILSGEGFFKNQIDHARQDAKDGHLKALVVRVNSPGGTITGSDYMLHHLKKLVKEAKIPVVVSMGGMAASGGYYVSMCVGDEENVIFAEPTTWTGSIGVIIPHYNVADLMKNWGIEEDNVASHRLKGMGSIARKMTEEERKIFQALVNDGFDQFKTVIKEGRPKFEKDPEALDKLATGQVYTADQALANGLVDKIGFVEDAIDRAIDIAKLDKEKVKVVKYRSEPRLADILLGSETRLRHSDLAALLDLAAPRAYYLCTWLPSVLGTEP
jgi:protease-4